MNKTLSSYVKIYNCIPKELCEKTVVELENVSWHEHVFYNGSNLVGSASGSKEFVRSNDIIHSLPNLMDIVVKSINQYIIDLNFAWFPTNSWNGCSELAFNKYETGKVMALHADHIHSIFDGERKGIPVLSVVCCFNDNYIGGKFKMFTDTVYELKQGDIIVFPSNFLFPHAVEEVIEGTRYSGVTWVW